MWQTPFAEYIKQQVDIPTIAVGDITLPEQINTIVAAARADLVRSCPAAPKQSVLSHDKPRVITAFGKWVATIWDGQSNCGLANISFIAKQKRVNEKALDLAIKARPNRRHYQQASE